MRTRLLRHPLGRWVEPAAAWRALVADAQNAFWLDSGVDAQTGWSYLGVGDSVLTDADGDVLEHLRDSLSTLSMPAPDQGTGDFALGWVGWLGYELRGLTMGESVPTPRYPSAALMFVDRAVAFDHENREVWMIALGSSVGGEEAPAGWDAELAAWRDHAEAALVATVVTAALVPAVHEELHDVLAGTAEKALHSSVEATWRYSDDEYLGMIEACQRAIDAGDAYQLCLTTEVSVPVSPADFTTYLALRESSPTHHGGLLRVAGVSLLSASPEKFLSVTPDGIVESSPIKGTRRRGADAAEDDALRAELLASDKERAENLMIVDLMRNDIGRISTIGSVTVPRLLEIESYPHVHQLVSTVRGQLAPGLDAVAAVTACFPAGSMTGAPKLNATRILDSLERRARGIYSGAFGYFGLDGAVDLAMVIRSIVIDENGSTVGTGGGITALSIPQEELEEVRLKAAALLAVLGHDPPP